MALVRGDRRLLDAHARLVPVGDVAQIGSVEAGRSFDQIRDAGMGAFKLEQIIQSNI